MLQPIYTNRFEKDIKRLKKRQKEMSKLKKVILLLLSHKPLPASCRDHALIGNYVHHRECHIEPDWLLIYKPIAQGIVFERTGSHADLFR